MSDGQYPPLTDATDDLPRTLRRERESRERAAREMQARSAQAGERTAWDREAWDRGGNSAVAQPSTYAAEPMSAYENEPRGTDPVTVARFKVPFFSLMGFFIKCVFAAIPALIILIAMLYGLGIALQTYFPQLIKMKILISFP